MKRPLSLNTQLSKLRAVNNLLKQSIPEAIFVKANGFKDTSYCDEIKQVIYSLRDIQYKLRKLCNYTARRSSQTRKMNIVEIREYLKSIYENKDLEFGKLFRHNMFQAYTELGSVEQYLQLHPEFTEQNIQNDELF